jgi:hypothetical protein
MIKLSSYSTIIGGIGLNKVADDRHGPYDGPYVGEMKNGLPHGQGTWTYTNGDKYVGEWKNGFANGHGTLTRPDGTTIVGEWKNGKKIDSIDSTESKDELLVSKREREEGINQILEDLHAKKITPENAKMRLKEWASRNNGWMKTSAGYPEDPGNSKSMDAHRGEFAEEEKKGYSLAAEIVGKPIVNLGDEQAWKLSDLALAYEKLMGTNVNPDEEGSLSYPIGKLRREIKIRI